LRTARGETAAAEQEVERMYASMKAGASLGEDVAAVRHLQAARARLAELRVEEARRACEARLHGCSGGEAAAEILEALRGGGVTPDAMCFRRALAACGGEVHAACHSSKNGLAHRSEKGLSSKTSLTEEAQWAQLIYSEAEATNCAGPIELALALRPCVLSRRWDVASDLLLAGSVYLQHAALRTSSDNRLEAALPALLTNSLDPTEAALLAGPIDPQEATCLLHQSLLQQLDGAAPSEAQARADAMLAECLLPTLQFPKWEPSRLVLKIGAFPPAAVGVLLSAALDNLCQAQETAGPLQTLIGSNLLIELSLAGPAGQHQTLINSGLSVDSPPAGPAGMPGAGVMSDADVMPNAGAEGESRMNGGVGETAAAFWRERGEVLGDRLLPDSHCASLKGAVTSSLVAAGMAMTGVSEGRMVTGRRSCYVQVRRRSLEGWVLDRCLRLWQGEVVTTELQRRIAEAEEARAAAASASAAERRQSKWERKNWAAMDTYNQDASNERSSFAVALDGIVADAARKAAERRRGRTGPGRPAVAEGEAAGGGKGKAQRTASGEGKSAGANGKAPRGRAAEPAGGEGRLPRGRASAKVQVQHLQDEWDALLADSAALVDEVTGIGPKRAKRLRAEGIVTASQLALLGEGEAVGIADRAGIPMGVLSACMREARQLVKATTAKGDGKSEMRERARADQQVTGA
jgi:predicted flap endonuclease-1-like 5' DNA nuclease